MRQPIMPYAWVVVMAVVVVVAPVSRVGGVRQVSGIPDMQARGPRLPSNITGGHEKHGFVQQFAPQARRIWARHPHHCHP